MKKHNTTRDLSSLQAHFKELHPDLNLDDKISANWVGFEKDKHFNSLSNVMCANILVMAGGVFFGALTNNITLAVVPTFCSLATSVAALIGNVGGKERIYEKTLARTSVQVAEMKAGAAGVCSNAASQPAPQQPMSTPNNMPADSNPYQK